VINMDDKKIIDYVISAVFLILLGFWVKRFGWRGSVVIGASIAINTIVWYMVDVSVSARLYASILVQLLIMVTYRKLIEKSTFDDRYNKLRNKFEEVKRGHRK